MNTIPLIITTIQILLGQESSYEVYSAKKQISAKNSSVEILSPNNTHLMMRVEYDPIPPQIIVTKRVTEVNP
jgi:hypothetical protein